MVNLITQCQTGKLLENVLYILVSTHIYSYIKIATSNIIWAQFWCQPKVSKLHWNEKLINTVY